MLHALRVLPGLAALLLIGCAAREAPITPLDSPVSGPPRAASSTPSASPPSRPAAESFPPASRTPPAHATAQLLRETRPATATAEILRKDFEVTLPGSNSLRVSPKNRASRRLPSLFEESILLGKIRAVLLAASPASRRSAPSASFQGGIATISFNRGIAPEAAAAAVSRMLSLDGVNEVRATFPND